MKYLQFFLLLFISATVLSQSNDKFTLKGKVIGQHGGFVHIMYFDDARKYIQDSCQIKNEEFGFNGYINEPTFAVFYGNIKSPSVDDSNTTQVFLEPATMTGFFEDGNFKKGRVRGSKTQNEFVGYNNDVDKLRQKWKPILDGIYNAEANNDTAKVNAFYNEQYPVYRKEEDSLDYRYIKQFPKSYVSAYLLSYKVHRLAIDSLKMYYSLLSSSVQQSHDGNEIKNFIVRAENLEMGKSAPDFTLPDINGMHVSLNNFKGKYVLLDFWASWCEPCREEHPFLKKAYCEYKNKGFEIVEVSVDREKDKAKWIGAIKNDSLLWVQLCDFKSWGSEVVNQYNILGKGIPSNFLLSPEGKILAKDLRGEEIEKTLSRLIK